MTDQNNSNSTSDELETVNEHTLVDNFLRQYKKMKLGMLEGELLSAREQQALTATIVGQPGIMQAFIGNTAAILAERAKEDLPIQEEAIECVAYFNSAMFGVLLHIVVPLLKMPEEQKKAIRENYKAMLAAKEQERGTEAPFDGLDFEMPNMAPGENPD